MKNYKFNKHKFWFWFSTSYLIFLGAFFLITMILQMNWFGYNINIPVFLWITSQPYVGTFFLPFIILSSFVSYYILENSKPVTVEQAIRINKILFEDDKITFEQFKTIHQTYTNKANRKEISNEKERDNQNHSQEENNTNIDLN